MGKKNVQTNAAAAASDGQGPLVARTTFEDLYPRLAWELLSQVWGDGTTKRLPSGLSVFFQDGMVKGCLRERNYGQVAFLAGATVGALLEAFERALVGGSLEYRADKFAPKGGSAP